MAKKYKRGKLYKSKNGKTVRAVLAFRLSPYADDGVQMWLEGPKGFRCLVRKAGGKKMRQQLFG